MTKETERFGGLGLEWISFDELNFPLKGFKRIDNFTFYENEEKEITPADQQEFEKMQDRIQELETMFGEKK